jgi:hypothetical protein
MAKIYTFQAKINLVKGGGPQTVQVQAETSLAAAKLIEAQYAGAMKSWFSRPVKVG